MNRINPIALFRLSVLGSLTSRERLDHGELQQTIRALAEREYTIPGTRRRHVAEKTIQGWYYTYLAQGIDGLTPKTRIDRGQSKLSQAIQTAILAAKRDNPRRSIRQIRQLLEATGTVARGSLSRSTVHRLLQQHGLSRISGSASLPEEKRSFVAASAGAIWYGDVMHGPRVPHEGKLVKGYLVSLFDDASRLVAHSAFCPGETALDIEGVLKQALLKRGLPIKLVVDNGAAYRAETLQGICARLGIHLIYCRPYAPEGKDCAAYCTSCGMCGETFLAGGGSSSSFALMLVLDRRAGARWFEEIAALVVIAVRFEQTGATPVLEGGRSDVETFCQLLRGKQATRAQPIVATG